MHGSHALFQVFFICSDASVGLGHGFASAVYSSQSSDGHPTLVIGQ